MRISDWSSDVCSSDLRPLAAREDGQQLALARQVEADDDTLVAMFDEEAVRAVGTRAHQLELVGGEPEPLDIVGGARLGVRHEDLRCRLFDDRDGAPAWEGGLCALGRKADNTAQLDDRNSVV